VLNADDPSIFVQCTIPG